MNKKQKKKLLGVTCLILLLSVAISLILYALKQNINLFLTPTQLLTTEIHAEQNYRLGGYVKKQSIHFDSSGENVQFVVTDNQNEIVVNYHGVLPNLFREGQGVVVTGKMKDPHNLLASEVLAKHDEKYMPWTLKKELEKK